MIIDAWYASRGYNAAIEKAAKDSQIEQWFAVGVKLVCLLLGGVVMGMLAGAGLMTFAMPDSPAVQVILKYLTF